MGRLSNKISVAIVSIIVYTVWILQGVEMYGACKKNYSNTEIKIESDTLISAAEYFRDRDSTSQVQLDSASASEQIRKLYKLFDSLSTTVDSTRIKKGH